MPFLKRFLLAASLITAVTRLSAQEASSQTDSLVRLMSAQSARLEELNGVNYRKVIGPARFLHNNTYLICDTAVWNVDYKMIDAFGNVQILQNETVLTSDKLTYDIERNLAKFRGSVVQLQDKGGNVLRTRYLDYNTKDSVAVFRQGGAMRDQEGQIIESTEGTYDSKIRTFTFSKRVNMFTDSIFVKTQELIYDENENKAHFMKGIDAWKDDNMLTAERGEYDRGKEIFFFQEKVHVMSRDQEGWSDSLYFYKVPSDVLMLGNVQVIDTTRNIGALSNYLFYEDSLSRSTLKRNAALVAKTESEENGVDTLYFGADLITYQTFKKCDIDSSEVSLSSVRRSNMEVDPVMEYRIQAAKEAAEAAEAERRKKEESEIKVDSTQLRNAFSHDDAFRRKNKDKKEEAPEAASPDSLATSPDSLAAPSDSLAVLPDSLAAPLDSLAVLPDSLAAPLDSLAVLPDSLAAPLDSLAAADSVAVVKDTTAIGFVTAVGNIRVFRKDLQAVCDSLLYSDLDSLARLFGEPIVWNEGGIHQYTADSLTLMIRNGTMEKANLTSNAFIIVQEDSLCYDQIRGPEMLAFFDSTGVLTRFDALGGANALFYIEENDALATVNKVESKMISTYFKDGNLDMIYYFQQPKNDAYPVVQLPREDKKMKGFAWEPEKRPKDKNAVTTLSLRPSSREEYLSHPHAEFKQTGIYFPGYMAEIYAGIARRDSLRAEEQRRRALAERMRKQDTASVFITDSTVVADSLAFTGDSLSRAVAPGDSVEVVSGDDPMTGLSEKERAARLAAEKKAAKEAKRQGRIDAREARWAELDARDAAKLAAKEQKALEKKRKRTLKSLLRADRQAEKDKEKLARYVRKYEKRKARAQKRERKKR